MTKAITRRFELATWARRRNIGLRIQQSWAWVLCHSVTLGASLYFINLISIQFSSVSQLCLTLCDPMDLSTPGFPVHHQLPELVQTHVHYVGDVIQPSHPLSSPSPPAFKVSIALTINGNNKRYLVL